MTGARCRPPRRSEEPGAASETDGPSWSSVLRLRGDLLTERDRPTEQSIRRHADYRECHLKRDRTCLDRVIRREGDVAETAWPETESGGPSGPCRRYGLKRPQSLIPKRHQFRHVGERFLPCESWLRWYGCRHRTSYFFSCSSLARYGGPKRRRSPSTERITLASHGT